MIVFLVFYRLKCCYFTGVLLFNPHTNYEHSIETSYSVDELKYQI